MYTARLRISERNLGALAYIRERSEFICYALGLHAYGAATCSELERIGDEASEHFLIPTETLGEFSRGNGRSIKLRNLRNRVNYAQVNVSITVLPLPSWANHTLEPRPASLSHPAWLELPGVRNLCTAPPTLAPRYLRRCARAGSEPCQRKQTDRSRDNRRAQDAKLGRI